MGISYLQMKKYWNLFQRHTQSISLTPFRGLTGDSKRRVPILLFI
jgi:hypothetical protein